LISFISASLSMAWSFNLHKYLQALSAVCWCTESRGEFLG